MPASTGMTLRRVRGCVAGGLSGATSITAHGLAGGGEPPSGNSIALLVVACAAFGATVSAVKVDRGALAPLLATIFAGQAIGHTTLMLGAEHSHTGLVESLTPGMLAFHCAIAILDIALIWLAESAATWALSLLHRLIVDDVDATQTVTPMWVVSSTPTQTAYGLLIAAASVTRGPPQALISH
ncbi:hypothetical protein GOEFS_115_01180 [Gordonia effusa NBRC 100432]|uniref:Uncharacterized protein n=1 Tax=Gordonia effusa NBRC 100432 TaxID=1077974 RepID=H0R5X7_9ACTN|nr:hypothetical protein [Gordonia effusa]GAB20478.1 hypothetical protein GOEFS_115_01180 [Gordonia effusa NBRC 100432]